MKNKILDLLRLSLFFIYVFQCQNLKAQSARDSLIQSVQQLQSLTGDAYFTLLEKIIDISTRVKPLPVIPETANEKYVTALALREDASSKDDFDRPISLLKEARTLAPWWSDVYKQLGATFEQAAAYDTAYYASAIANFQRFLRTQPVQEDERKIQNEIYIVNAKKEKAIQKQKEAVELEKEKLGSLVGEWNKNRSDDVDEIIIIEKLTDNSYQFTTKSVFGGIVRNDEFIASGTDRKIEHNLTKYIGRHGPIKEVYELSDDGKIMYVTYTLTDNNILKSTFKRK